ncbi:MAG: hypothetical protein A2W85_10055 [Bacteroidetes bacterium GWF2_41_31]|nr:MAG: hypothetical protein A2W85_10055 [Bacteroidetes bacterium GWF2_41_31]
MKRSTLFILLFFAFYSVLGNKTDLKKINFSFWAQVWYQHVEKGKNGNSLNDFMVRRAYLSVKGQPTDYLGFFAHIAVDRLGQDGLDNPGLGLGSGLAFRDLWITLSLNESFKIQVGRMYVPLTRNYGTTSTKALLTTDLSFMQGGIRGGIFYTSKVGRDDGVTLWGNPFDGRLQYRLMVSEGIEDISNPNDQLRLVGRVVVNLLEPEIEWFNQGTYLGQKKILSFGTGIDSQNNLILNGINGRDNLIWTVDGFLDHPLANGAVTAESAYIHIRNSTQANTFTNLAPGDNAGLFYIHAGYYFSTPIGIGNLQPYLRYENVSVEQKNETSFLSGGFNYYLRGHNAKFSIDYTIVDYVKMNNQSIMTLQLAVGI